VYFGLGTAKQAKGIEVRWPSGHVDRLSDLQANPLLEITEGQAP
jgi:hypothetical protein